MATGMKFGLGSINGGEYAYPDRMIRLAQAAEKAGFDSVWCGGHPFLSEKQTRIPSSLRALDPIVALTFIAANTHQIRLATGITLLPQFNPLILAKELTSLDVLSNGRLIFGIGVGWSEHEYEVLGIPYHDRGRRADEYLKVIKTIWTEDRPVYKGRFASFENLQSLPHPVQRPYPDIVIGGNSPGTFRRAVEMGNGWFGYWLTPEETSRSLATLREVADRYSRPSSLGDLEITITPRGPVDRALAEQYSKIGVNRLILVPPPNVDASTAEKFIESAGRSLVGQV
jgi:probable F420-dependent oxidoreductase